MNHAQRAGRDHDNNVANALHVHTPDDVRVVSMRGSGNTNYPAADVMVIDSKDVIHDVELKRKSIAVGDKGYVDIEDLDELPDPVWFGIKFTHREMALVEVDTDRPSMSVAERLPDCFEGHVTDAGRLRLTKPTAGQWNSAQSGKDDWEVVADALGLTVADSRSGSGTLERSETERKDE